MQQLKAGSFLQGGKYKIEKVLGQGGFGITYLAAQELLDRKVCIKEFFFKEYCERDEATSHVTLGTSSNRELVERFMEKFIKEARTISTLNHPHIIRIYDIFKENNTAYYVMEYIEGMSLAEMVKQQGAISEDVAVGYIKQVASALKFVHQHSISHLDVKPANIMVRKEDNQAVLIDFGLSKQYDVSGEQTSTTPVGISHGYAPMEQYNVGGVGTFSPQTDIYALGATFYKLITGNTPPQAGEVLNEGLPELPSSLSLSIAETIKKAMQPRKVDRANSIDEFLSGLNVSIQNTDSVHQDSKPQPKQSEDEATMMLNQLENKERKQQSQNVDNRPRPTVLFDSVENKGLKKKYFKIVCLLIIILGCFVLSKNLNIEKETTVEVPTNIVNGHEYMDLGLSIKWATCNVGASLPSDYGDYFAWGEISSKSIYTEENSVTLGEYHINDIAGDSRYDAARIQWGGSWRLPTRKECTELIEKCKWVWTSQEGHDGYKVIGPNGNSIFLPASGWYSNSSLKQIREYGLFWSSTPGDKNKKGSYGLSIAPNEIIVCWLHRNGGLNVRPVTN